MKNRSENAFKTCSLCRTVWETRSQLLHDPDVQLVGYQVDFEELKMGLFFFNHLKEGCHTTFGVRAGMFRDLYNGPVFERKRPGAAECAGYCLHNDELRDCEAPCECAYVRHILQVIRGWPKKSQACAATDRFRVRRQKAGG